MTNRRKLTFYSVKKAYFNKQMYVLVKSFMNVLYFLTSLKAEKVGAYFSETGF